MSSGQPIQIDASDGTVRLALKVVPGARRARVMGLHGGALKLSVAQPPEGGAANKAVCELLAGFFGLGRQQVQIVQGHSNPWKRAELTGIGAEQVRQAIERL